MTTETAVTVSSSPPSPPSDQVAGHRPRAAAPVSALRVSVLGAQPDPGAVAPQMLVRLRVEERSGAEVLAVVLHAQVRVEPQRRAYGDAEEQGLLDLFGDRCGWSQTVRPFLWAHATAVVQAFTGETEVDLVLPCSYDVEVAGAKYLQALGQAWLRADRGAIAGLTRYEAARGHSTWEQTLGELLAGARSVAR